METPKKKNTYKKIHNTHTEKELTLMEEDSNLIKEVSKTDSIKERHHHDDHQHEEVSHQKSKPKPIEFSPRKKPKTTLKTTNKVLSETATKAASKVVQIIFTEYVFPCILFTFWLIIFGLSQIAWQKSLLGCQFDIVVCIKWLRGKFVKIILYVVAYTLVHFYIFVHALFHRKKFLKISGLLMSTISFSYRWLTSDGFDAEDHSKANFTLCLVTLIFICMFFFWWFVAIKAIKSKNKKFKFGYFIFWIFFWFMVYDLRVRRSCRHLQDSLDPRVKYSNKGDECRWERGKICWHFTIDGIFQPLFWGRDDCSKISTDLDEHRKM